MNTHAEASTPRIEFQFDFGSPNAYLCHKLIPQIEARLSTRIEYVPVLLGGLFKLANNRSPMEAYGAIPNKMAYQRLEMQRFIRRHGLSAYRHNPNFPVNTLKIMRGALAARRLGVFDRYVDGVYAAMWEQGLNMADDAVIAHTLTALGIDAAAIAATSQLAEVKAELVANTEIAHARGAFGSPSFFVGSELFFGKDRLREVEEEFLAQRAG